MPLRTDRLENAKERNGKLTARCPACAAAGQDATGNHLVVFPDGKFGCVANPGDSLHRQEIFRLIGDHTSCQPPIPALKPKAAGPVRKVIRTVNLDNLARSPRQFSGSPENSDNGNTKLVRLPHHFPIEIQEKDNCNSIERLSSPDSVVDVGKCRGERTNSMACVAPDASNLFKDHVIYGLGTGANTTNQYLEVFRTEPVLGERPTLNARAELNSQDHGGPLLPEGPGQRIHRERVTVTAWLRIAEEILLRDFEKAPADKSTIDSWKIGLRSLSVDVAVQGIKKLELTKPTKWGKRDLEAGYILPRKLKPEYSTKD
jgi:hypothetical protein